MKKKIEKAMQLYGPIKLANVLFRKGILNPVHNYILRTLKHVSVSYQSSVLFEMLQVEFEYLNTYQDFKKFVENDTSLKHLHTKMGYVGKYHI